MVNKYTFQYKLFTLLDKNDSKIVFRAKINMKILWVGLALAYGNEMCSKIREIFDKKFWFYKILWKKVLELV